MKASVLVPTLVLPGKLPEVVPVTITLPSSIMRMPLPLSFRVLPIWEVHWKVPGRHQIPGQGVGRSFGPRAVCVQNMKRVQTQFCLQYRSSRPLYHHCQRAYSMPKKRQLVRWHRCCPRNAALARARQIGGSNRYEGLEQLARLNVKPGDYFHSESFRILSFQGLEGSLWMQVR